MDSNIVPLKKLHGFKMKKGIEQLNKNQFTEAEKIFLELLKANERYILPKYFLCKLYLRQIKLSQIKKTNPSDYKQKFLTYLQMIQQYRGIIEEKGYHIPEASEAD